MSWSGVFLPVTTPFRPDGEVDTEAFASNLEHWSRVGISGVLVGGSTGEAILLDEDEFLHTLQVARETLPADLRVIAGTGRQSTRAATRASARAAAAGADAVLVYPPSYFRARMDSEALRRHFVAVADASPVPVFLYHVPKFVSVGLEPGLVGELVRHDNIVGIKDSSGDMSNLGALTSVCDGSASVFVGAGTHLYPGLELGAAGGIVAVGLLAAAQAVDLYTAHASGRATEAGRLQETIGPLHRTVVAGLGVPGVKVALDELGLRGGPPRPPLLPLGATGRDTVSEALRAARIPTPATRN